MLSGNVLITGGAGFLARGIYRRARQEKWDARFVCLSRDDAKHAVLQKQFPEVNTVIADVGLESVERLTDLMLGFDTVIHAAAFKYVDRAERYATATIQSNIIGSMKVAEAARRARVKRVIGISTDKACAPINIYGVTKMAMERIFQENARLSETAFTVVRYGNVIGSTGSVIPMFVEAARLGNPLRVTDPQMTRFWMSLDEAVDTVLVGLDAPSGVIVIPPCASMTMEKLAEAIAKDSHSAMELIGIRPGEKRHESLLRKEESIRAHVFTPMTYAVERYPEWVYLDPPDHPVTNDQPFEIVSNKPLRGWLKADKMRAIIEDSASVYL